VLGRRWLDRWLGGLLGLAAGCLFAGAALHMMPAALHHADAHVVMGWFVVGFGAFLAGEALLRSRLKGTKPQVPLILVGDGLHNLIGGVSVGAAYLIDPALGAAAWLAAAAHELPQELGDFGVLVDGGLSPRRALGANFLSALLFPAGALASLLVHDLEPILPALVAVGAGNFVYIAAVDLLPEVLRDDRPGRRREALLAALVGAALLAMVPHAHEGAPVGDAHPAGPVHHGHAHP